MTSCLEPLNMTLLRLCDFFVGRPFTWLVRMGTQSSAKSYAAMDVCTLHVRLP